MKTINTSGLFKAFALCVAFAVILPSAVKFSHIFQDHEHQFCIDDSNVHFHELDLDCEFYKFQVSKVFYTKIQHFVALEKIYVPQDFSDYYISYTQLKQLTQFQRGPPQIS